MDEFSNIKQFGFGAAGTAVVVSIYAILKCLNNRFKKSKCQFEIDTEEQERQKTLHKESIKEVLIEMGLTKKESFNLV